MTQTPELVEREREVAALAALLAAVPEGEGRVAWIEGPAGIGKSALLAEEELAHARSWGAPGTVGPVLRILGLLRRDDGLPLLEQAVAVLERSHARLELAKALADLGAALPRSRPRARATATSGRRCS